MNHHEKAMDSLDACIFSGDLLWHDDEREQLKEMIIRWTSAIHMHELNEKEEKK